MSVLTLTEENPYVNISAYKFITFEDHAEQRQRYYDQCAALNLKGTILLTPEGINMFLAGFREIDAYMDWLHQDPLCGCGGESFLTVNRSPAYW
jgi:UPF0176 protein